MATKETYAVYSRWRKSRAKKESDDAQKSRQESKKLKSLLAKKEKLSKSIAELSRLVGELKEEIKEECPHRVERHELTGYHQEDWYSRQNWTNYYLDCTLCGVRLADWTED
jgi:hypothetical protein